jgi:hypothetical protein
MNIAEIDDALSAALHALSAAQATLRKSLPGRSIDVLRKSDLIDALPRASRSDDVLTRTLATVADLERRAEAIEGARRDMDAQTVRKTYTIREAA